MSSDSVGSTPPSGAQPGIETQDDAHTSALLPSQSGNLGVGGPVTTEPEAASVEPTAKIGERFLASVDKVGPENVEAKFKEIKACVLDLGGVATLKNDNPELAGRVFRLAQACSAHLPDTHEFSSLRQAALNYIEQYDSTSLAEDPGAAASSSATPGPEPTSSSKALAKDDKGKSKAKNQGSAEKTKSKTVRSRSRSSSKLRVTTGRGALRRKNRFLERGASSTPSSTPSSGGASSSSSSASPDDSSSVVDFGSSTTSRIAFSSAQSSIIKLPSTEGGVAKLLTSVQEGLASTPASMSEWKLNYALLYSAYQRTSSEGTKGAIRFLMANYLTKAAFLNTLSGAELSMEHRQDYLDMLQVGLFTMGGVYHRTADEMRAMLRIIGLEYAVGSPIEKNRDLTPLDTMEVQSLFCVSFVTTPGIADQEGVVEVMVRQFENLLAAFSGEDEAFFGADMDFPFLIDITEQIGQSLITCGDEERIAIYEGLQQDVRGQINAIMDRAVANIKEKHPDRPLIQSKVADYLRKNTAVVSRAKVSDRLAVLGAHRNIFIQEDFDVQPAKKHDPTPFSERHSFLSEKLKAWTGITGVGVGGVNFRRVIAETHSDPLQIAQRVGGEPLEYAVTGNPGFVRINRPLELMDSNIFKQLTTLAGGDDPGAGPAQQLLANATTQMLGTLLCQIPEDIWIETQKDPAVLELAQIAAIRTLQHLATAMLHKSDFRQFSQAIDRVHAELTTLLTLYSPFDPASFEKVYGEFLKSFFPESIKPSVVGVAKAAMSVFSGVNAIILNANPGAIRICAEHSYYEEIALVGGTRTLSDALADPAIGQIDLYVAEFYHNIDIDPNHIQYQKGTVIEDIRKIFEQKKATDQLTVAIDATIDFVDSNDIKALLKEFIDEIQEGKLNLVVFRSGQKFDMMGLDNYYGSIFYVVNNNDEKWDEFNRLKTDEVFHTDELSQQYFSWMAETGPEIVDDYKKRIFDNTKAILDMVPDRLKPVPGKEVCVCGFDDGVITPFIDIKIAIGNEEHRDDLNKWVQDRFMELFISNEKLVYRRGSFGFAHPNLTWIDPKMRINPGLDPEENELYRIFFQELEEKVRAMMG